MSFISRTFPALILLALGVLLTMYLVPIELEQMKWEIPGRLETYPVAELCRPGFLAALCFLPFAGAVLYGFMGTMDRYMTRNFISYFLMCTMILLLIYILADFTDNMERFRTRFEDPVSQALHFYGTQLPMFLYQILPYTLLMGTLWCLSKLCGGSEIVGMMQSGRSLLRLCRPIFIMGTLVALGYGICGYHWAPSGSLYREMVMKRNTNPDGSPRSIVYRSDATSRIWRIVTPALVTSPGDPMVGVTIDQFDSKVRGRQLRQYRADRATWNKEDSTWTLENVYIREMAAPGVRPKDDVHEDAVTLPFEEKPYQIISPGHNDRVDAMSTAGMYEYLASGAGSREDRRRLRTEWHVRLARIVSCMVLVLLAIPSSVTFQRRGTMKGIGIAVLLAALMLFFYRVFPSLGEAGVLKPWLSAWIPNILYIFVAIYLFVKNLAHRSVLEWMRAKLKGEP